MRILLSDGSGLTSRQAATILGRAGHEVEVLDAGGFGLTHATRWVRRVHRVPGVGVSPFGWLAAAEDVLRAGRFDAMLATQEQVAVLSLRAAEISTPLAVPSWPSLRRVQDKISAYATLAEAGLPQPDTIVATDRAALEAVHEFPAYVKPAIGTASTGVRRVADRAELLEAAGLPRPGDPEEYERSTATPGPPSNPGRSTATPGPPSNPGRSTATPGPPSNPQRSITSSPKSDGVLVQRAVDGHLLMVQSVFDRGRLVAWHVCRRAREGSNGGASGKISEPRPEMAAHLAALGTLLDWHGALSLDAIATAGGIVYIDVNPRLVEPVNALLAGVDLVGALLAVTLGRPISQATAGRPGVRTHQLILALTRAATSGGRTAVARELAAAATARGPYRDSREELTPMLNDPRTALLVAAVAAGLVVSPRLATRLTGGTVASYALTPSAWHELLAASR